MVAPTILNVRQMEKFKFTEFHTPSGNCQIRTMLDHTGLTRLPESNMSDN